MKGLKNNTLAALLEWFRNSISEKYDANESRSISRIIFHAFFGLDGTDFVLKKDLRFSESQIVSLYKAIKQLNNYKPVQHITGKAYFRQLELKVNEDVLIPRPETEELVEWIVASATTSKDGKFPLRIWDIGTGSGAIAISLAKELNDAEVIASDTSEKALDVATHNAAANSVSVQFIQHDILSNDLPDGFFDLVVSNPPYIKESEKSLMRENVLLYEPHSALFVPDEEPLVFYAAIAKSAFKVLKPGGKLYFEINESLGDNTLNLVSSEGYESVIVKKDIFGKDRFVMGVKP